MALATGGDLRSVVIEFPNQNPVPAVLAGPRRSVSSLLEQLGLIEPRPVILVVGGADTLDAAIEPELVRLFERGAVRAAFDAGATLLDGGTDAGVMRALGRAAGNSDEAVAVVGVAPAGKVTWPGDDRSSTGTTPLEPNHTHFLLANGSEWGAETSLLFDTFDRLRRGRAAVAILAGGGELALDEARLAAHRGIPIIAISGTGGKADELATRALEKPLRSHADLLSQMLDDTDVTVMPLGTDPTDLQRTIGRLLGVDETLAEAWRQQRLVSAVAGTQQHEFRIGQSTLLLLGLLLTFLVITKASLDAVGLASKYPAVEDILGFVIVLLPISIATFSAAAARFRPGNRWVLLRGTSEALKREIWRYRARAGIYSHEQTKKVSRQVKLAEAIGSAMGALMRTDVNALGLAERPPRAWPWSRHRRVAAVASDDRPDNKLAPVSPDDYVRLRVNSQIEFYLSKASVLERQARWLRWLAWIFGAIGTLFAAIGLQIWVAVTTALVGVYTSTLEAWQLETTVTLYNQAATDLTAIRAWWNALPSVDQDRQANIDRLVERSEQIMRAEHAGWVQEMQDAMTKLRLEQATADQTGSPSAAGSGSGGSEDLPGSDGQRGLGHEGDEGKRKRA